MKLKKSAYVLCQINQNGDILLYNTLNKAFIKIPSENAKRFQSIVNDKELTFDESNVVLVKLKEKGFLINEDFDEERKIEELYNKACHSNDELNLIILPTEKCNFRCVYCYESYAKGKMSIKTQESIVKFVKKELKKYKSLSVGWFGGEPLLALDVIQNLSKQFIDICKEQRKHYFSSITTNGYLLNLDVFKILFKLNVLRYQITIDGLKDIHDKQRKLANGSGTFDKIINNLRNIRENMPSRLYQITIRSNLLKTMDDEKLSDYFDFYDKEFGHDSRFSTRIRRVWDDYSNKEIEDKLFSQMEFNNLECSVGVETADVFNNIGETLFPCYASKSNSIVIGSDGKLYKCTVAFDREHNKLGEIDENGVVHIDDQRFLFFTYPSKLNKDFCNKCPILPMCLGARCPNNQNNLSLCKGILASEISKIGMCSDLAEVIEMEV